MLRYRNNHNFQINDHILLGYGNNHSLDVDLFLISRCLTINFLKYYTINFNILFKSASILYLFLP